MASREADSWFSGPCALRLAGQGIAPEGSSPAACAQRGASSLEARAFLVLVTRTQGESRPSLHQATDAVPGRPSPAPSVCIPPPRPLYRCGCRESPKEPVSPREREGGVLKVTASWLGESRSHVFKLGQNLKDGLARDSAREQHHRGHLGLCSGLPRREEVDSTAEARPSTCQDAAMSP